MRELSSSELVNVSGGSDIRAVITNSAGEQIGETTFCTPESIQAALDQFAQDPTIFGQLPGTSPFTISGGFNDDGSFTTNFDTDNDGNNDVTVTVDNGEAMGNVDLGVVDIDFNTADDQFRFNVGVGSNGVLFLDVSEDDGGGTQFMLGATLEF